MLNNLKFFRNLTIKTRFKIILGVFVIGYSLFGLAAFKAITRLSVNGPIYQHIIQGKDITADVLPPPEYIIESYLVALQLDKTGDAAEIETLVARFRQLKNEYESRHQYWQNQPLSQELQNSLLDRSYLAAKDFYQEAEQNFLPLVQSDDHSNARTVSLQKMRRAYERHRAAIDDTVKITTALNNSDEAEVQTTIRSYEIFLTAVFIFSIALAVILTVWISRIILRSLQTARQIAGSIAEGDLSSDIDTSQPDEIGDLFRSMQTMQNAINAFVADLNFMAQQHAQGWVKEQLNVEKFPGTYGKMAEEVNELIQSRIAINRKLITIVSQYAKGDFSADMDQLPGETATITRIMDETKKTFLDVNNEIKMLAEAGAKGDFSKRSDAGRFEFMFKEILTNFNQLFETCDAGFNDVLHIANAVAQGDLTQTIARNYPGAFGEVIAGMNRIVENLKHLVGDIKYSADTINAAAQEIAAGNNNLSHRTEVQASSLEETAASMGQLTATVQNNATNAREANQLAVDASGIASKGVEVVDQVVATMSEINESSHKIGDIISVIDDIAFQTNLLALNAAVEAARAGEQGRGFAVVATEVRNLAQRAATAADEIKNLINDSVSKVAGGSKLVLQAGQTMEEIVVSINSVNRIIAEITSASAEQSAGIEQINLAIGQMDDVTQQNAALVEQAAASAESLEDQTQSLSDAVNNFKMTANARYLPSNTNKTPKPQPLALQLPGDAQGWEEF
ncbi:MAG: methyl-accepting chemotaxis protein [Methylobacter sp.]